VNNRDRNFTSAKLKRRTEEIEASISRYLASLDAPFLTRKLNGVSAEMSLNVLAYNLKRVMKIIGTEGLLKAMAA
jgi:hypothetical protein